jgi:hypothetical protein
MSSTSRNWFTGAVFALAFAGCLNANMVTVDLSSIANNSWGNGLFHMAAPPTGSTVFDGVPFLMPSGANNAWFADTAAGGGDGILGDWGSNAVVSATVNVGVRGVTDIFTLINSYWGQPGTNSYLSLTFRGSAGTVWTDNLYANSDFRDWNNWQINSLGSNTVNVWNNQVNGSSNWQRLDMQHIYLPSAFATQTLQTVTITDFGGPVYQRAFWAGLTVDPVEFNPEPSTVLLMVSGLTACFIAWKRRQIRTG